MTFRESIEYLKKKIKRGHRDRKDDEGHVPWTGLKTLLRILESATDAFGPLKLAVEALNAFIELFDSESSLTARKDYEALGRNLDMLLGQLAEFTDDLTGSDLTTSVKIFCSDINAELAQVGEKLKKTRTKQYSGVFEGSEDVLQCYRRIHEHVQRLMLDANLNTWKTIDKEVAERRLLRLAPVNGMSGSYDSLVSDKLQRRSCTTGTRRKELKELTDWAHNSSAGAIYWINGMAGTGKTTISYSLCTELAKEGRLAASFFCTRAIRDCRNVQLIIPAVAYQIARFSDRFRHSLSKALANDPDAHTRELKRQYQKLIIGPLEEIKANLKSNFVVVIDALDECEDIESVGKILDLLVPSRFPLNLPIQFLVSSRPEPEIYSQMMSRVGGDTSSLLVLHALDQTIVKDEIKTYLEDELQHIPYEMPNKQWNDLIQCCGVLFIFAATACRHIKNNGPMIGYNDAVSMVLGLSPSLSMEKELDRLYTIVLQSAFEGQQERLVKERMKSLLDTIICTQELMTTAALASLLGLEQVNALLQPLRSVIQVTDNTTLVTILHTSFRDFLLSPERSGSFHCDGKICHTNLTRSCLQQLRKNSQQFNICHLESSFLLDNDVEGLEQLVEKYIPPSLQYACCYWVVHLGFSGSSKEIVMLVEDFLSVRLLLWMEVLNLTKCMGLAVGRLQQIELWCKVSNEQDCIIMGGS